MQFGRFHGLANLILGVFLLACQAWLSLRGEPTNPSAAAETSQRQHRTTMLPGILGGALLVLGATLIGIKKASPANQLPRRDLPIDPDWDQSRLRCIAGGSPRIMIFYGASIVRRIYGKIREPV